MDAMKQAIECADEIRIAYAKIVNVSSEQVKIQHNLLSDIKSALDEIRNKDPSLTEPETAKDDVDILEFDLTVSSSDESDIEDLSTDKRAKHLQLTKEEYEIAKKLENIDDYPELKEELKIGPSLHFKDKNIEKTYWEIRKKYDELKLEDKN